MNMRPATAAALLGLAALAPPARADGEWQTVRNEMGTVEFQAPPGYQDMQRTHPNLHVYLQYGGGSYKSAYIKVWAHQGYTKPEHIKDYMKFVEGDVGGKPEYAEGSTTRFTSEKPGSEGTTWVCLAEGRVAGGYGFYILAQVPKDVFDETKDDWTKVLDSFKATGPAPETFEIPPGWKVVKNDMFVVIGPVNEIKDAKLKQQLENRLYRVQTWLDPVTSAAVKMFRSMTNDERKYPPKQVVRVLPTPEEFKAAAGDLWTAGVAVVYLPDHKDRALVVDGSPDSPLEEGALAVEAGVQHMESRVGRMWPWLREAVRVYFENGIRRKNILGAFPPEMLKRGKEVFAARPATFEDLMKRDEAGMRELGEPGRVAAWGILQCGLHGDDGSVRNMFRRFLREAVGAPDPNAAWEKAVAGYQEETKKKLKPKDIDLAARKYFKDLKEEKK